jgi:uncharacterized protein (TIGR00661 family)
MKILYGIQGTGHGHISRAREIVPSLSKQATVDLLISGYNCNMHLNGLHTEYRRGFSLVYNLDGGISYSQTLQSLKPFRFLNDISFLNIKNYDLVISDFEPVTAWAAAIRGIPSVSLSHQASFLSKYVPRPKKIKRVPEFLLKYFAPGHTPVGFHFKRYDSFILPPVIRSEVRELHPYPGKHITVYLPAFSPEKLISIFNRFHKTEWHLFSPSCTQPVTIDNVQLNPIGNETFLKSLESCRGLITGAGFEACAEAMYLGKKLLAIPIKGQYEQVCNATALSELGVMTAETITFSEMDIISNWLDSDQVIHLEEYVNCNELAGNLMELTAMKQSEIKNLVLSNDYQG